MISVGWVWTTEIMAGEIVIKRNRKTLRRRVRGFTNRIVESASTLAASSFLFIALWSSQSAVALLNRQPTTIRSYKVKRGNVFYANKWISVQHFQLVQVFFPSFFFSPFPPFL